MPSMLINREALESGIYNPRIDSRVLALQQIMETQDPATNTSLQTPRNPPLVEPATVDFELREYVEQFNTYSVYNPFQGVLDNPTSCLINPIRDDFSALRALMDSRFSGDPSWTAYRPDFITQVEGPNGLLSNLDSFEDHTDRLTNNLPSLAGIAQAALALTAAINLLSNPCLGLDGFLGSIMDEGKAILRDVGRFVKDALGEVTDWVDANIGPLVASIGAAVAAASAAIADLIAIATQEVINFAKAMLSQVRQGLAELMANLPQDPCLRNLLGSVVTGTAAAVIGG